MKNIKLSAVGDILLSGTVAEMIKNKGYQEPFIFVQDELRKSDLVFGNLECSLSNRGNPLKNKCCLYSPPETAKLLKSTGFNVISLANNHIFDYGYEGFKDTTHILKKDDILYFGAGKNLEEARKPVIISINDISIGFLGYAWNFIGTINAAKNKFGTAPLDKKIILEDVKNLKERVDKMIVSLHWGYDGEGHPLPSQRDLAHKIIDAGANLILGHHPHILQGIEKYENGIIAYSLGEFVFPNILYEQYKIIRKPENKESIILKCEISKGRFEKIDIIPTRNNDLFQPVILKNKEKEQILSKVENLSEPFLNKNYQLFWRKNRIRKDLSDMNIDELYTGRAVPSTENLMNDSSSIHEQLARTQFVLSKFDLSGKRILDVGCGTGYSAYYIKTHIENPIIIGVDISEAAINFAREKYPGIKFIIDDRIALSTDFDEKFDFVFSFEVLEHVDDQSNFLCDITKFIKKDGYAVISTPNRDKFSLGKMEPFVNPTHIKELDLNEFKKLLKDHFWEVRIYGQYHKNSKMQKMFLGYHRYKWITHQINRCVERMPLKRISKIIVGIINSVTLFYFQKCTKQNVWERKYYDFVIDNNLDDAIWFLAVCKNPKETSN